MYTPDDLQVTDVLTHIREHPERYLADAHISGSTLTCRILADILAFSNCEVLVQRVGDWWSIGSPVDWLGVNVRRVFFELVPAPGAGPNSFQAESLLTAFARDVLVFDDHGHWVVAGQVAQDDPIFELPKQRPDLKRLITFRMNA